MGEILEKEQIINVVPVNFKNSNKGKIIDFLEKEFLLEVSHSPDEILVNKMMEFYSQTNNGMLYFSSTVTEINGNVLKIRMPIKHRFLQRRAFTRVKFIQNLDFKSDGKSFDVASIDLSAGGLKLKSNEYVDINGEYDVCIRLSVNKKIRCQFELIRIEKNEENTYTLSGRFKNLSNTDKMTLIQFCMKKNMENMNK